MCSNKTRKSYCRCEYCKRHIALITCLNVGFAIRQCLLSQTKVLRGNKKMPNRPPKLKPSELHSNMQIQISLHGCSPEH